jgi:diacylglycerol O-acyltransferase / wax synthase
MNNVLDLVDQAMFLGERATGATGLLQCVWVYDRAIDVDGLRQFHRHLQRGQLRRCVERSPLRFGRHRWVSPVRPSELEIAGSARPRDEFDAWLREQANAPLDSEHGPGWHLAVLPFTDGGTGVSLVISHCLADGVGLCEALADAACGREDAINWPAAGSRRRGRALREDARQTARDFRGIGRALKSAAAAPRLARSKRGTAESATAPTVPGAGGDERITLPMATIFVDADEWDARARALGGTSNVLLAGLAASLAQRAGRVAADGSFTLATPVNERVAGDTRANAVTNVDITVDGAAATTDLSGMRAAIKEALIRHREAPDDYWTLLPLVPLLPKRLVRRMVSVFAGSPTTVVASNLGVINPAANRPDGTDADYFTMTSTFPGATKALMRRAGGRLALGSGTVGGRVFVTVVAFQPGRLNSNAVLQQDLSSALDDFSLTGTTGWGRPVGGWQGIASTTRDAPLPQFAPSAFVA